MRVLDKLINNIKFDKKYVLFNIIIVLLGIITGSLFIVMLNTTDKNLIIEYITSFVDNIKNNSTNNLNLLINTLLTNYIVIFILAIIGFSCFLFPISILILFYKSFIVGFCMSSFILCYRLKGILLSIIYIFPHLIINILIYTLLTAFTIKISLNTIKYIIKKKELNMRLYFNKFFSIVVLSIFIITITSLYETYVIPYFVKLTITIF